MRVSRVLAVLVAVLVAAPAAFALPGIQIGVHGNYQNTVIEADVQPFTFPGDAGAYAATSLTRTEIGNPIGAGVDLTLTALPIIDLQVSAEMVAQTYDIVYSPPPLSGVSEISEDNVPYGRLGVDATIIKPLIGLPPVVHAFNLYVGAGASVAFIAPIASETLILDNITSTTEQPDIVGYAEDQGMKIGFHALVGFTLKAPILPGIRVQAKYYKFSDVAEPDNGTFVTLQAGLFI